MLQSTLYLLVLTASAIAQDVTPEAQGFTSTMVVPDVIPAFNPTAVLTVTFTDPASGQQFNVTPAENLTIEQTTNRPVFSLAFSNSSLASGTFVIAMVDPDAPTPATSMGVQFRHMMAGDLTLSGGNGSALTNSTPALTDYETPGPPAGSPAHRYVLLVFQQPANFDSLGPQFINGSQDSTARLNFNVSNFALETGLGSPIAGTLFMVAPASNSTNTTNTTSSSSSASGSPTAAPTSGASAALGQSTNNLWTIAATLVMGVLTILAW